MRRLWIIAALVVVAAAIWIFFPGVFVPESRAIKHFENHRYTDIVILSSHRFFARRVGCGEGEVVGFTAMVTNPLRIQVTVIVCCPALGQDCTDRLLE